MKRREFLLGAGVAAVPAPGEPIAIKYRRPAAYFAYREKLHDGSDEFGKLDMPRVEPVAAAPERTLFAEVTGSVLDSEQLARGIPYWMARLDAATGIDIYGNNGIAVGDVDGDGTDEIYVCQPSGLPNRLFRWREGRLADISAEAGVDLLDDSASALFIDLRNLGRQDLVVLRSAGPVLFLNDGRGKFRLAADAFRFATPPRGAFTGMAAADYDRDGRLDLYCCAYSFFRSEAQFLYPTPYHDAQNGPPNFLFRNRLTAEGGGYFEDVTAAAGLDQNNNRYSFAPAWCDYDGSGWPSLYVANDFGRNNLYRNEKGRFRDVAAEAGVEDIGPGMSAAWFDEDGDGRADLYVANMWTAAGQQVTRAAAFRERFPALLGEAWRRHAKGNSLYRNRGAPGGAGPVQFEETGAAKGVEMGRWAWSSDAADLDFDGRPEIFVTCGMLTGPRQPDLMGFFWRQVVAKSPASAERSTAYEEGWNAINQFIREGYSWNGGERNVFYRRDGERYVDASRASGLDFAGDSRAFAFADIDGDGCLDVVVKNRLAPQMRIFQNRCGQDRQRVGLRLRGTASNRDGIGARVAVGPAVQWLSAGSGYLSQHTKTLYFPFAESGEVVWPSGQKQRVEGLEANALYEVTEGAGIKLIARFGQRRAIEVREARGDNEPRLHETWLQDPVPLPEARKGPGLLVLDESLGGNPEMAAAYSLFRRYLFEYRAELELPFAMLLNRDGHAVKVYASVPSSEAVAADLQWLDRPPALPYPGRALSHPRRDYFKLGAALLWSGYGEQALPYLERVLTEDPASTKTMALAAQVHREAGRLGQASRLLDEAIRLNPTMAEAWNERGGVALAEKKPEEALEFFEQALVASPDLLYALLNAAQTAAQLGRVDGAEGFYRRARKAHPRSADAANGLGLLLAKAGRGREAEPLLRVAVSLDPGLASAWNNLAVLLLRERRNDEAIESLEQGIARSPSDEALYLNLGRIYVQTGRREEAIAVMRRLMAAKPDSAVAKKALTDLEQ